MLKRNVSIVIVLLFLFFFSASYFYRPASIGAQGQTVLPSANSNANQTEKAPNDPKLVMQCEGCHGPGKTLPFLGGERFHKEPHRDYELGFHSRAANNGKKAASCLDCHTADGDMSTIMAAANPKSTIFRGNISQTCGRCHTDATIVSNGTGLSTRPSFAYAESVHGKALSRGNLKAAVCTDCHRSHDVLPGNDSNSSISKFNIAQTCGSCHGQIFAEFNESVHGVSLQRGNYQSPNCTDCHGIHSIRPQKESREALGLTGCSQCHDGVRLSRDFGIPSGRVSSFEDSYHGRAKHHGSDVVADCASCHGVHNILPSSDPKSLVNTNNLIATCGQCHIGAGTNFTVGKVHLDTPASQDIGSFGIRWVRNIYLFLIVTIVGGMLVHNGVIWYRKAVEKRNRELRTIQRMTVNQRVQHWMLLTSFIVLVITGFALEYPDGWLGVIAGGSEGVRRIIHRGAAVVMLLGGTYHLFYLALSREGRQWFWDMLPAWKDVTDLWQNAMYFIFKRGEKPKFARFRYADKAEYWAVVWGTILMGLTGLMIWFKVGIFGFLPRWAIDIGIAVHFYEAILATLAIVVWHFYHVVFDPDVYPLNWAFYDGKISEEMFKEEHEQMWEDSLKEEDEGEEMLDEDEGIEDQE